MLTCPGVTPASPAGAPACRSTVTVSRVSRRRPRTRNRRGTMGPTAAAGSATWSMAVDVQQLQAGGLEPPLDRLDRHAPARGNRHLQRHRPVPDEVEGIRLLTFLEDVLAGVEADVGRTPDQHLNVLRFQILEEGMCRQDGFKRLHGAPPSLPPPSPQRSRGWRGLLP